MSFSRTSPELRVAMAAVESTTYAVRGVDTTALDTDTTEGYLGAAEPYADLSRAADAVAYSLPASARALKAAAFDLAGHAAGAASAMRHLWVVVGTNRAAEQRHGYVELGSATALLAAAIDAYVVAEYDYRVAEYDAYLVSSR